MTLGRPAAPFPAAPAFSRQRVVAAAAWARIVRARVRARATPNDRVLAGTRAAQHVAWQAKPPASPLHIGPGPECG